MTREEIIRVARSDGWAADVSLKWDDFFVRFATMVAAAEREAIAQMFDKRNVSSEGFYEPHEPAEIIRSRGQA